MIGAPRLICEPPTKMVLVIAAPLGKALRATASINKEVLQAINVILKNFPKLHISEAATLCIPHLVVALGAGNQPVQESVLDTLCLLKHSWSTMPVDVAKAQAMNAAEAIPTLQLLMRNCTSRFYQQAESLLHCLPGCLTVTIKRGINLKQSMGSTNAFCRLMIGNGPPRQTKVVHHSSSPEWKEAFSWAFDMPPKGQKLHILCKSKSTFGKSTLGRVTIRIDEAVTEGICSGCFDLTYESCTEASARSLDIEIVWSNRMPNDSL
ncbi:Protein CELLULOSE SYNTHASE INTERACTIVE 3 [Asimina triloba]